MNITQRDKLIGITFILLLLACRPAFSYYTAGELESDCKIAIKDYDQHHHLKFQPDHLRTGRCIGYVSAIVDSYNFYNTPVGMDSISLEELSQSHTPYFCIDKTISKDTIIQSILTNLSNHPDILKESAAHVVIDILQNKYPCPSKPNLGEKQ